MAGELGKPLLTPEEVREDRQEARALLARANAFTDRYARVFFRGNTECVEALLHAYLGRDDIRLVEARTQAHLDHLITKSIVLDILATDDQGRRYNLELQCDNRGSDFKRMVHHGSALNVDALLMGERPKDLPEISVLWLTRQNATGTPRPIDWVARILVESSTKDADGRPLLTGRPMAGDAEYYYVDCSYQEEGTTIGDVNHDLLATDAAQMRTPAFRKWTHHYKGTEEGREKMDEDWERFVNRRVERGVKKGMELGALERAKAMAQAMLADNEPMEKIAKYSGFSLADLEALKTA